MVPPRLRPRQVAIRASEVLPKTSDALDRVAGRRVIGIGSPRRDAVSYPARCQLFAVCCGGALFVASPGAVHRAWPSPADARDRRSRVFGAQAARGQQLYQGAVCDLSRRRARGRRRSAAGRRRFPRGLERAVAGRSRRQDREDHAAAAAGQSSRGRRRSIWRRSCCAPASSRAGQADSGPPRWDRLRFRRADVSGSCIRPERSSFAVAGNLAQLMRGVTFPNANILFNVQVKDPAKDKPAMPMPVRLRPVGIDGVLRMAGGRSGCAGARRDHAALPAARTAL